MGAGVTAGVGLSLGQHTGGVDIAKGAFTLFAANLVGIVGVAILVFITRRYGRWKPALAGLAAVLVLTGTLVEPLSAALNRMVVKSTALRLVAKLPQTHPELFPGTARLEAIDVRYIGGQLHIHLRGTLPEDFVPETQATLEAFQGVVSGAVGEEVFVQFEVTAVDTSLFRVGPRPNAPRGPTRSEPTNSLPEGTE